ncbi:MAG: DUF1289 domain-containing protein [Rhodobacteraceae bacterium]|jgi:hypothetical protein|nr:DUF1289 domain-containing protein [Alphaproteobacteria bacterium]NNF73481.1 DUF1289 domain-containing protein [Paracoccaceae bacterium]NNK65841.1 DUF1289 domain-containing protein [Paracoccaceae bacterium]
MAKVPSPCIDVCKYKRQGHCIGCSMTKAQKSLYKTLKKPRHRAAFVGMLKAQQDRLGKYGAWSRAYARKCDRKGVPNPAA